MSKHSKWSKVKHQKGVADVKRAAVFTKLARAVTVAAREGGGDPAFNFKLRTVVDQALAANMPKDNIERAIKKGTGEIEAERVEPVMYEGFAPGGIAVLVEAFTDNRNRTAANIKHLFSSHGGSLAAAGAVQWMFVRKGVLRLKEGQTLGGEDELAFIDAGAEDIARDEDETEIITAPENLAKMKEAAERAGFGISYAGLEWRAKEQAAVDEQTRAKAEELLEALDDDEDAQAVYTNL